MAKKMLIDATHAEETRVVVAEGARVEEFDYESANKKQLRGNIYLAKVTRVEPSLQAAFVDYGGNRHGFLAFSEIHPDYYQIPVADREALAAAEAEEDRREAAIEDNEIEGGQAPEEVPQEAEDNQPDLGEEDASLWGKMADRSELPQTEANDAVWTNLVQRSEEQGDIDGALVEVTKKKSKKEDSNDEIGRRRRRYARRYKIQEVIKRRQVLLVQVVKEERGNKGAALTTYLSLAGRYSVLMPNTGRGGGISRKITNMTDRRQLKSTVSALNVPDGMGLIIRTAGANRTKAEIKRDYEYLLRLWESVRDLTLQSSAPALVYEEGSLIKRSIRDLYNRDIDSILVEGDEGYKEAKGFMKMLIPSHAKNVQPYRGAIPLFQRHQVETQLDSMFHPVVQLKSGGYIVINPTEALVAIDVNSGRATREHSVEDTALKTNLEAVEEVSRQLRLRDLAGLIVIDLIDMEEHRNNRAVERKLKDGLRTERARIQVGRISSFGLLEMSRQRLRSGLHEGSTVTCPHCEGTGLVKSVESSALSCLRALEEEGIQARTATCTLKAPTEVSLYLLNQKRAEISRIENTYQLAVSIEMDEAMLSNDFELQRGEALSEEKASLVQEVVSFESGFVEESDNDAPASSAENTDEAAAKEPRKRRRRRGGRRKDTTEDNQRLQSEESDTPAEADKPVSAEADSNELNGVAVDGDEEKPKRRRRRGRRGGRRNRRPEDASETEATGNDDKPAQQASESNEPESPVEVDAGPTAPDPIVIDIAEKVVEKPKRKRAPRNGSKENTPKAAEAPAEPELVETVVSEAPIPEKSDQPTRKGWWQKRSD